MGSLDIRPGSGLVRGEVKYIHHMNESDVSDGLSFYIPMDFEVSAITGEYVADHEIKIDTSTYIGQFLKTINIKISKSVTPKTLVEINFTYSGIIDLRGFSELNYPTTWIEVSPNTLMLIPIPVDIPEARYNLRIKLPTDFQVIAPGRTLIDSDYQFMIDSQDYIKGVYFIIGKSLSIEHLKYESTRIRLVSYKVPELMKERISEMAGWTIDYYNRTFGKERKQDYVTIALRPSDEWDASFAAGSNYFVSYDSQSDFAEKEEDYYATYAHEMAHFWWKEADALTNSNWLNEGFAEFSSMLAIKSFYGEKAFEKKVQYHKAILDKVPKGIKLGNFERFGKYDQPMSYSAGALLLYDVYLQLGEKEFNQCLAKISKSNIHTTDEFVDFLIKNFKGPWLDGVLAKI